MIFDRYISQAFTLLGHASLDYSTDEGGHKPGTATAKSNFGSRGVTLWCLWGFLLESEGCGL